MQGKYLSIRVNPKYRALLRRVAKVRHQNVSQFVRMAIDEKIQRERQRGKSAAA